MEKAAHHKSDGNIENFQHEEKHEENGDKDSYDLAGNNDIIILLYQADYQQETRWTAVSALRIKEDNGIIEMEDNILGYEFVNIRYWNLVQVHNVEFLEKYLCIELDNEKIVAIAYDCDSDYTWVLEEYNDKEEHEKMAVFCQEDEIVAINIPEFVLDGTL